MNASHVIAIHAGAEGAAFRCEHCTLQYTPPFPMPLDQYVEQGKGFALMHRRCEKPAEPTRQMTLPHRAYAIDGPALPGRASDTLRELRLDDGDGIDGSADEPAREIDPPDDDWTRFVKRWPAARDAVQLRTDLSVVLQGINVPTLEQLEEWHPDQGKFDSAAHWTRLELAHMNAAENPDLVLPPRQPMPEKLAELVNGNAPKKARKARGKAEA
jgi:hypothetical protein